jgi:hypothetical protein
MELTLREKKKDYKLTLSPDELDCIIAALGYAASYAEYGTNYCRLDIDLSTQLKNIMEQNKCQTTT